MYSLPCLPALSPSALGLEYNIRLGMRISKQLLIIASAGLFGCMKVRHTEECTEACLSGGQERAIEHLTTRLGENRAELEWTDDPARRYVILEIIAGIEAHIEFIESRRK